MIDSINFFYRHRLPLILSTYVIRTYDGNIAKFENPFLVRPKINDLKGNGKLRDLWPYECRRNGLSYMAQVFAKLQIYRRDSTGKDIPIEGQSQDVYLGKIPAFLHTDVCHLARLSPRERYERGEPEADLGDNAIIKGATKVLLNIEKLRTLKPFLYEDKGKYIVRYTSQTLTDTTVVIVFEDNDIHVTFTKLGISNNSINIFYIFYILGLTNDTVRQVFNIMDTFIVDSDPIRQARRRKEMRIYMQNTVNIFYTQTGRSEIRIYDVLAGKFHDPEILNSVNRNQLIVETVRKEVFKNIPFVYSTTEQLTSILLAKIRLLASMVTQYVEFKNGYRKVDDRDSYGNKKLSDVGEHLWTRTVQIWKNMTTNIQAKVTSNRYTTAAQIKLTINQNYMTEQFINSFNKELWGASRGGTRDVTRVDALKRDTLLATHAQIRRISTPTNRRAKIREKRLIHNTQWGAVCPVMTPEGEACIQIETPVMLANGNHIQIKDLKDGNEIMTINPMTLEQSPSKITKFFIKSSEEYGKPILKISTLNGREIVCTDDHPFLTQYGWICAKDLNPSVHVLAVYPGARPMPNIVDNVKIILDEKVFKEKLGKIGVKGSLIEKHIGDLKEKGLLPLANDHQCLPILSRISGFCLADGSLSIYNGVPTSSFCFGTQYDGELFQQDIEKLGYSRNTIIDRTTVIVDKETNRSAEHNTWRVQYGGSFASLLLALDITYGKRVDSYSKPVPNWILNGTPLIKREFVSGFQGGDGSKITWTKRQDKIKADKFNLSRTLQHKCHEHVESLVVFMTQVADIMKELGVEVLSVRKILESNNRYVVRIDFSDKEENIMKYMEVIGYRYATTKSTQGYHLAEYLRYKQYKIQERIDLKNKVLKYSSKGITHTEIAKKLGLRTRQITSILEYTGEKTLDPKDTLGMEEWMKCSYANMNCVFMPIGKIESHPHCIVADFTTESDNHSMISNGFVTHNCGLVKDSALTAYVSLERDDSVLRSRLDGHYSLSPIVNKDDPSKNRIHSLYLNGVHLGYCNAPALREELLRMRRNNSQIYFDTGIILNEYNELWVMCNSGRICRPLLIVDPDTQELVIDIKGLRRADLSIAMNQGAIEYIDIAEQEQTTIYIAETINHLRERRRILTETAERYERLKNDPNSNPQELEAALKALQDIRAEPKYTHCEVDPTAILGISASTIPLPEYNPGPRDTYQAAMGKQALGPNSSRIELRFDTTVKTILEPGVPTFSTDAHEWLGLDEYPAGQQIILAITTYGGENQEDALIFNEGAIKRGLFMMVIYHSYKITVCQSKNHQERIRIPDYPKNQADRYSKLDPTTGIVRIGEYVKSGDCLVGKVVIDNSTGQVKNDSLYVDIGKEGVVDEVFETENAESCKLIRIRIRELRRPEAGDK
ncbi:MAG: hypothetical protein QXQ02_04390, partial [Halobacteria archaeon]